jgi:hypothetical protein
LRAVPDGQIFSKDKNYDCSGFARLSEVAEDPDEKHLEFSDGWIMTSRSKNYRIRKPEDY